MKKTRILSVVAVLCLLLGMFAGAAVAEETPELKKIGVAFMKNDPFMVPLYNGISSCIRTMSNGCASRAASTMAGVMRPLAPSTLVPT